MERTTDRLSRGRIKLDYLLVKWEKEITILVTLCAVFAIILGAFWLVTKRDTLLFLFFGLHLCYLTGRRFWKFRDRISTLDGRGEATG